MTRKNAWPEVCVAELRRYKAEGDLSNAEIGEKLGFSTSAVAGMWRRLNGGSDKRENSHYRHPRKTTRKYDTGDWETRLREPYEQFKLRKQAERQQCRS